MKASQQKAENRWHRSRPEVVVTGASAGVGQAIVREFAQNRDETAWKQTAAKLKKPEGARCSDGYG